MATLHIITAPDPRLKEISIPVSEIDKDIQKFMDDLLETMYRDYGVGLAAIQVGVAKQIIVMDLKDDDDEADTRPKGFYPLFLVNPQIIWASSDQIPAVEGCLSVPTLRIEVVRPKSIKVKYLDYYGKHCTLEATGWLARAIQHEMDHLKGKLTIDYLSTLKKELAVTKLKKFKKHSL